MIEMRERLKQLLQEAEGQAAYYDGDDAYGVAADYLIDNGVIVPPCKIGDTVYRICKRKYDVDGYGMQFIEELGIIRNAFSLNMYHELGKTVFLTREAAEKALKARENK